MGGTIVRMTVVRVLVVTALLVGLVGAWSTSASAKSLKPTISGFVAAPAIVRGPSGYVHLSAGISGAASCSFMTSARGATFTPANLSCTTGKVATTLFVPQDVNSRSKKVLVVLLATGTGGTRSAVLTVIVKPGAGGRSLPGAPASVMALASDRSATVKVGQPISDGGSPVISYSVAAIDLTSSTNGGQIVSGSSTSLVVGGLVDGDRYQFVATATNLVGTGPPSGTSNVVIPDPVPGIPTGVAAVAGDGQATVSFVRPGNASADMTYRVSATDLTSPVDGGQIVVNGSSPVVLSGLTNGERYVFTVQAINPRGFGPVSTSSNQVIPDPFPGTPSTVAAVAGDGRATVSFVPPGNASADTTYRVASTDLTTPANGGQNASGITGPIGVSGLTNGDWYVFTVQAVNAMGTGPVSAGSNGVVPDPVPGPPTGVTAVGGDMQAVVSFVPAVGDSPSTTYRTVAIDHTSTSGGGQIVGGAGPVTVAGLVNGDSYTFTVTAERGTVEGTVSLPSNSVVPAAGNQTEVDRAVGEGRSDYLKALNANPGLAQCNSGSSGSAVCGSIHYGIWNQVNGSSTEYYAVGNPQPTFDPVTHALDHLTVQIVGAAHDPSAANNYVFKQVSISMRPANGFLTKVWWTNYESFSRTGDYSNCNYNWKLGYNMINGGGTNCFPVSFGPVDYLFGPVFTNDSVFVYGDGTVGGGPSFGNSGVTPNVPSPVTTADPNCLFVDNANGMSGSGSTCSAASGDVALYDTSKSAFGTPVQSPPQSNAQLGIIASQNGCLYSGPTQITLSKDAFGVGQMTVVSPNTVESTVNVNGQAVTWDTANIATNYNNCPNNGTAPIPTNGVVFVQNATTVPVVGANPFDNYVNNSVTNLTADVVPTPNNPVTLTATVTSASSQIPSGATVSFSETTSYGSGNSVAVILACSAVSNWSAPILSGSTWSATATCATTDPSNGTGAFSATYSGGTDTSSSQTNLGQTNTLTPTLSYGSNSQTNAGGCSSCYYGQSSSPDAEGDAFVKGSLSGQLTIGTANNVVITGNLTYADCSGKWITGQSGEPNSFCPYNPAGTNDSLGLVANNYVEVNHPITQSGSWVLPSCGSSGGVLCDPSDAGGGITIDATILALTQSFVVNNFTVGNGEGKLAVYGSIQQFARGPVGTFSNGSSVSGYIKHYTWNPLLTLLAPPSYLNPWSASWAVSTVTANTGSTSVCPPLFGVYVGTDATGVIQDGPPITNNCSAPTGGLPDYPPITAPAPPTGVAASPVGTSSESVRWIAPAWDGGTAISGYVVTPYLDGTTAQTPFVLSGTATTDLVPGLNPNSNYSFTVAAVNAAGTSGNSDPLPIVRS